MQKLSQLTFGALFKNLWYPEFFPAVSQSAIELQS